MPSEPSKHWFALKVFFNKVAQMATALEQVHLECYYPVRVEEKLKGGKKLYVKKPAVNSLLFFKGSLTDARTVQRSFEGQVMLYTYRLSHQPAIIPEQEMNIFRMVSNSKDPELEYMDADASFFKTGQHVHVTGGIFEGAEGYIKRIRGNKRLIVAIEGIVAVATSYIPSCFLEKLED